MFARSSSSASSSRRFDAAHRRHSGVKIVRRDVHRDWEIAIEHRTTGMTIQRDQYSVKITDTTSARQESLRGFCSHVSAIEGARRRIDFILDIRDYTQRLRSAPVR